MSRNMESSPLHPPRTPSPILPPSKAAKYRRDQQLRRSVDTDSPFTPASASSTLTGFQDSPITPQETYAGLQERSSKPAADEVRLQSQQLLHSIRDGAQAVSEAQILLFQDAGLFGVLKIGQTIGRGQWSKVQRAWTGESQTVPRGDEASPKSRLFAIKVADGKSAVKVIRHEARILSYLATKPSSSQYVVGFHGYDMLRNALVLEYLAPPRAVTLFSALVERPSALISIAGGLIEGLDFLHKEEVVHGDIKPGNIFVRLSDANNVGETRSYGSSPSSPSAETNFHAHATYQPIYCDFSASSMERLDLNPTESAGTYDFMAPELFTTSTTASYATMASDVYALGLTLISVAAGRSPYDSASSNIARRAMAMQGTPLDFLSADFEAQKRFETSSLRLCVQQAVARRPADRCSAQAWNKWFHDSCLERL